MYYGTVQHIENKCVYMINRISCLPKMCKHCNFIQVHFLVSAFNGWQESRLFDFGLVQVFQPNLMLIYCFPIKLQNPFLYGQTMET